MMYQKLNSYTWILKGKNEIISENIQPKQQKFLHSVEKTIKPTEKYKTFCKSIFGERKFICIKEFNKLIRENLHISFSYYRKDMQKKGLIAIDRNIVKPGENLQTNRNL